MHKLRTKLIETPKSKPPRNFFLVGL